MIGEYGPYRIVRKIAVGGMAEIYLARQRSIEGLERTVVLKRILSKYSKDEEFVTMFLDEARLMAALSHPNIAQVFDLGKVDGSYYLVMEYVRGPTLGALLAAATQKGLQGLPEKEALGIGLAVAEALAYVHGRRDELGRPLNIVHRDLNPSNVIVSYDGAVKLIDFGIAKTASKVYETRTGVIKGTYGYIAPEQFTGAAPIDHRADVFALGVLLYEMCVGQHPFEASDEPNLLERIFTARYKRPRQVVPSFPPSLDRIIAKCLAPHPEGRPDDVRTLIGRTTQHLIMRGMIPTMGEISALTHKLVPDDEGPAPLRALSKTHSIPHAPESTETHAVARVRRNLAATVEPTEPIRTEEPRAKPETPFSGRTSTIEVFPDRDPDVSSVAVDPNAPPKDAPAKNAEKRSISGSSKDPTKSRSGQAAKVPAPSNEWRPIRFARSASKADKPGASRFAWGNVWGLALVGFVFVVGAGLLIWIRQSPSAAPPELKGQRAEPAAPTIPKSDAAQASAERSPNLRIVSEPPGAKVAVDGLELPSVTPTNAQVRASTKSVWVRVTHPGYLVQEREVQVNIGETRFVLVPISTAPDAGKASPSKAGGGGRGKRGRKHRR